MTQKTIGSLFAGIGGFDLGFERAGFTTAWTCEIDQKAQAVLRLRFPQAVHHDDVTQVGAHNLGPVDVVTFGSPCQDLSVAGKRAGLAGGRSGLFHESVRIIRELRERYGKPDFAVWENVPGAFSSNGGRDFAVVVQAMVDLGARDVAWRVLDSRFFGVAQRRRRVFLVADFGGERASEILDLTEGVRGYSPKGRKARQGTAQGTGEGSGNGGWRGAFGSIAHAVTCHAAKGGDPTTDNYAVLLPQPIAFHPTQDPISSTDQTHSLSCGSKTGSASVAVAVTAGNIARGAGMAPSTQTVGTLLAQGGRSRSDQEPLVAQTVAMVPEVTGTLGGGSGQRGCSNDLDRSGAFIPQGAVVRRRTPTECCRLQGFPDAWNAEGIDKSGKRIQMADSSRYKQLGNAVTVNVAEWIGRRIELAM